MVTPQTLQAINDMQVNVQSGLPVIPNNGNPAGAHNMPQGVGQAMPRPSPSWSEKFPWMQQSPFMATLSEQLKANGARLQQEYMATNAAPIVPSIPAEAAAPMQQAPPQVLDTNTLSPFQQMLFKATGAANPAAPVMPQQAAANPLPQGARNNLGPVMPTMGLNPRNRTEIP